MGSAYKEKSSNMPSPNRENCAVNMQEMRCTNHNNFDETERETQLNFKGNVLPPSGRRLTPANTSLDNNSTEGPTWERQAAVPHNDVSNKTPGKLHVQTNSNTHSPRQSPVIREHPTNGSTQNTQSSSAVVNTGTNRKIRKGNTRNHESYIFIAILVTVFFNPPFGLISLCISVASRKEYQYGDRRRGERLATLSLVVSMTGLVLSIVVIIICVFHMAHLQQQDQL